MVSDDLLRRHPGDKVSFMAFEPRQLQRNSSFLSHLDSVSSDRYDIQLVLPGRTDAAEPRKADHCMEYSIAAGPEFGKI